jgi:hypothetical protein
MTQNHPVCLYDYGTETVIVLGVSANDNAPVCLPPAPSAPDDIRAFVRRMTQAEIAREMYSITRLSEKS